VITTVPTNPLLSPNYSLDQLTAQFRVAVATTSDLSAAYTPVLLEVHVKFVHPCHSTTFSDTSTTFAALTEISYYATPHPSPESQSVSDFPYALQGSVDCGP